MVAPARIRQGGVVTMIGGVLWMIGPVPVRALQSRSMNAFFMFVSVLLVIGLLTLQARHRLGWLANVGYLIITAALGLTVIGAVLEVVFTPVELVGMGLGGGRVFLYGLYLTVVGAPILGVGLWYSTPISRVGPGLLILTVPLVLGLSATMNQMGLGAYNWAPFTVPFGAAWLAIGYHFLTDTPGGDESSVDGVEVGDTPPSS